MRIYTDHKWREFLSRWDVPEQVLDDQFDYQDVDETMWGYFKYKNTWYHADQFVRLPEHEDGAFKGWHGYAGDSYFSGVVIRLSDDGERFQVGTYIS